MAKQLSKPVRETLESGLWLGTEASYETYLKAVVSAAEFQARGGSMEDMMGDASYFNLQILINYGKEYWQ